MPGLPTKKADVGEHPEVFHRVGLPDNKPTGNRFALYLVFRKLWSYRSPRATHGLFILFIIDARS